MGQMQPKILGRMRAIAEANGLDFIEQPEWGNTGTVYVQDDDLDMVAAIRYDFQTSYARFTTSGAHLTREVTEQVDFTSGESIRAMLGNYCEHIGAGELSLAEPTASTAAAPKVLWWDWKEQPPMADIAAEVARLTGGRVRFYMPETDSDAYALIIADREMTPEQAAERLHADAVAEPYYRTDQPDHHNQAAHRQ